MLDHLLLHMRCMQACAPPNDSGVCPSAVNIGNVHAASAAPRGYLGDQDVFLTRKEAAEYLRRSVPTLERWAGLGTGPPYRRVGPGGKVLYPLSSLRAFVAGKAA
jgi:hypothetical protein